MVGVWHWKLSEGDFLAHYFRAERCVYSVPQTGRPAAVDAYTLLLMTAAFEEGAAAASWGEPSCYCSLTIGRQRLLSSVAWGEAQGAAAATGHGGG